MTQEVQVFMRHVRSAGICANGARLFFSRHGLDWNDFLSNGIGSAKLDQIGDPIALRAADAARAEVTDGR
jgi:hypothetical protein